jgi:hypothetical protein
LVQVSDAGLVSPEARGAAAVRGGDASPESGRFGCGELAAFGTVGEDEELLAGGRSVGAEAAHRGVLP